jgi:hypothetical protein
VESLDLTLKRARQLLVARRRSVRLERMPSGMEALLNALLNLRPMPPELRRAWANMFDHYVFHASDENWPHSGEQARSAVNYVARGGTEDQEPPDRRTSALSWHGSKFNQCVAVIPVTGRQSRFA